MVCSFVSYAVTALYQIISWLAAGSGERDAMVPAGVAKEILKVNPRIQVELVANAAHASLISPGSIFLVGLAAVYFFKPMELLGFIVGLA